MTTKMIVNRFSLLEAVIDEIVWINSSTCKLKYATEQEASMVLERMVVDSSKLKAKREEDN